VFDDLVRRLISRLARPSACHKEQAIERLRRSTPLARRSVYILAGPLVVDANVTNRRPFAATGAMSFFRLGARGPLSRSRRRGGCPGPPATAVPRPRHAPRLDIYLPRTSASWLRLRLLFASAYWPLSAFKT